MNTAENHQLAGVTFVDVRDHGAVGDGVTDDTVAIHSAISTVGDSGGVVFFPSTASNTYIVSTIRMEDRVTLQGEAATVTIRKLAGTAGPVITNGTASGSGGRCVAFKCLLIDGNKRNCPNGTDGIGQFLGGTRTGYYGDGVVLKDVRAFNCRRHGINIGDTTGHIFLLTCKRTRARSD